MDLRIGILQHALTHRAANAIPRENGVPEAAVAIVVRPHEQLEILLIRRAIHERDPWSGHMALPGGRRNSADSDLAETALRETEEETGVAASRIGEIIGKLDELSPRNPRLPRLVIAPFVVVVPEMTAAAAASAEVDAAVWIPVAALREPGAAGEILIQYESESRAFPSLQYGEYVIWGLTHRILQQFFELLDEHGL